MLEDRAFKRVDHLPSTGRSSGVVDRLGLPTLVDDQSFQRVASEIATRLGGIKAADVDDAISASLRQIAEILHLDRAVLWRTRPGEDAFVASHYWIQGDAGSPEPFPTASIPSILSTLKAGQAWHFHSVDDLPDADDRDTLRLRGLRSGAAVPLPQSERGPGVEALALSSTTTECEWTPVVLDRLRLIAGVLSQALARAASRVELQKALDEVRALRDRLAAENTELRREVRRLRSGIIVSESPAMKRVLEQVDQVAPTPATVLLLGETGAGKDVIAQEIHDLSPRHQRQMVRVSCAAIPAALIESELFGRERGAYTGALSRQIGRFEAANQSTLFLDEIGELSMEVQVKLLRVLQERAIERLGSTQTIKVDVRIIAATNRNLEEAVAAKTFREDLYYRLHVFPIVIPPLRERPEDIPGLVWSFVDEFSKAFGKPIESISKDSLRELQQYHWPGNIRELRNVVERAVILAEGRHLAVPVPRSLAPMTQRTSSTLSAVEIEHIRGILESTNWRVRGPGGAAERLGLKPTTLESRMAKLGIRRQRTR
jgi:transcriptional regulator with GAF, ATPase, and Fis domain